MQSGCHEASRFNYSSTLPLIRSRWYDFFSYSSRPTHKHTVEFTSCMQNDTPLFKYVLMKTESLSSYKPVHQTAARVIKLPTTGRKRVANKLPLDTWLISIVILPAIITGLLLVKSSSSIFALVQFYFYCVFFGALFSLPVLLGGCFVLWFLTRCRCSLLTSRIVFLFTLISAVAIGYILLQIFDFSLPGACLYTASISVLVPGIAHVFK